MQRGEKVHPCAVWVFVHRRPTGSTEACCALLQSSTVPPSPKRTPAQRVEAAMSDAGLKGANVFLNLTPAQLYEKVCDQHAHMNSQPHGCQNVLA